MDRGERVLHEEAEMVRGSWDHYEEEGKERELRELDAWGCLLHQVLRRYRHRNRPLQEQLTARKNALDEDWQERQEPDQQNRPGLHRTLREKAESMQLTCVGIGRTIV